MSYKKLIVPLGTALAALIANTYEASTAPADSKGESADIQAQLSKGETNVIEPLLQRLTYQIKEQAHTLTLHQSSSGLLYAGHGSHASHASHQSHRSGY